MVLKRRRLIGSPMCLLNLAFRHFNVVRAMFWVEIVKHTAFDLDTGNLETAIATKNPVLQRPLLVSARSSGDRFSHRCYHTVPPGSWPWASPPHTSPSSRAHWLETLSIFPNSVPGRGLSSPWKKIGKDNKFVLETLVKRGLSSPCKMEGGYPAHIFLGTSYCLGAIQPMVRGSSLPKQAQAVFFSSSISSLCCRIPGSVIC